MSEMDKLINTIAQVVNEKRALPFSVYSSYKEQQLLNVPIVKPSLIVVLKGSKELGRDHQIPCSAGDFIFLADNPALNMRNIPKNNNYLALFIEFDYQDYQGIQLNASYKKSYYTGKTSESLVLCLQQFVESSQWAPASLWSSRKRELLILLSHLGHDDILAMLGSAKLTHQLHDIFVQHSAQDVSMAKLCHQLAMSESSLRRKLKAEGTSVQEIKDQARLGLGLHLCQTTSYAIGLIAEKCGYQSQSKFTERFKTRFGLTPSELRKTQMADQG